MVHASLLESKISPPRSRAWHLERPHLTPILQQGLSRSLTVLVAPAGYGKTATLSRFLAGSPAPWLWLQLDAGDNDLVTFGQYLSAGLQRRLGAGRRAEAALDRSAHPEGLLALLLEDLRAVPGEVVVVLDDFHLIERDSRVIPLVEGLIQRAGDRLHLYICTRAPLPFSVARLKVSQEAVEINLADLRFTPDETRAFLAGRSHVALSDRALNQVADLTEGWPAALVLMAACLERHGSPEEFLAGGLSSDLFAYLADELISALPHDLQVFMEQASILEACTEAACNAVLGRWDSRAMIDQILAANLIVHPLGPGEVRFHHLLRRYLEERLKDREGGTVWRGLHRRAARWHQSGGRIAEAGRHYALGGWHEDAARLLSDGARDLLLNALAEQVRSIVADLPDAVTEAHPWVVLLRARMAVNGGEYERGLGLSRAALHAFSADGDAPGRVHSHLICSEVLILRKEMAAARAEMEAAEAVLSPGMRREQAAIFCRKSVVNFYQLGATQAMEKELRTALAACIEAGDIAMEAEVRNILGAVCCYLGDFPTGVAQFKAAAELQMRAGADPGMLAGYLGWGLFATGRFAEAMEIFRRGMNPGARKMAQANSAERIAYLHVREGRAAEARAAVQTAFLLAEEVGHPENRAQANSTASSHCRLLGSPAEALPFATEAMKIAKQFAAGRYLTRPFIEGILLQLLHTGNTAGAARMAGKVLAKLNAGESHVYEKMLLSLMLAVARFRQTGAEARIEAVRVMQSALTECERRGMEFFVQHEWPLALAAAVHGLVHGLKTETCISLIRAIHDRVPPAALGEGIRLPEAEAKLVPAAWQALPAGAERDAFVALLTPADRRRVAGVATGPVPLVVRCLGDLSVHLGPEAVEMKLFRRRKAGSLLVLLLAHDGPVRREEVLDRLWPDLDADSADASLRVSLHYLRRLLEPHLAGRSKSRYIQSEGGLLWFSRHPGVSADVDLFREALARAAEQERAGDGAAAAASREAACRAYAGDLAAGEAAQDLRNLYRQQYADALEWLGQYRWYRRHDLPGAVQALHQRLALDPACERVHQALIRIYLEAGQPAEARRQFNECKAVLTEMLGIGPGPATAGLLMEE